MALLETQNLSVNFGALAAVSDVSFSIEPGERLALIGPNGAGKTTLFNLLTGQLKPSGGKIFFKEEEITNYSVFARTHLGIARSFQIASLFPDETVAVNAAIALLGMKKNRYGMWGALSRDKSMDLEVDRLLESVQLLGFRNELVSSLAYGQQRKLEMALSLASGPELLLLDEPSCGLTSAESAEITTYIRGLGSKITVLIVAHDMDLIFGVAERIILLHYGKIAAQGTKDEVRANQLVRDIYMGSRKVPGAGG